MKNEGAKIPEYFLLPSFLDVKIHKTAVFEASLPKKIVIEEATFTFQNTWLTFYVNHIVVTLHSIIASLCVFLTNEGNG